MKQNSLKVFAYLMTLVLLASCSQPTPNQEKVWNDLPEVTDLANLKQTEFVATLESPIATHKNVIYAPALLYAWDKVAEKLKSPIVISDSNSQDFKLLNRSQSYRNSLADSEYVATAEIVDGAIIAKAFFNKTLPFETQLQALYNPILFDTTKVAAFGMSYFDKNTVAFTHILYYADDNHFILKLSPKDKQHEIWLVKGLGNFTNLAEALQETNKLIEKGQSEANNSKMAWQYEIVERDIFSIPAIHFNISTHYKHLEGQSFLTQDKKQHGIEMAYQRTGFILNEHGAVAQSEAVAQVDSVATPIHPKKMIFDKPFLVIVKRVNQTNPYFVMKVDNAELLVRQ